MIDVQFDLEFRGRCSSDADLETLRKWKTSSNLFTKLPKIKFTSIYGRITTFNYDYSITVSF